MNDSKKLFAALLLFSTFVGSVGQLMFKLGVNSGTFTLFAAFVVGGVIAYCIATFVYLYILGRSHLSWAYGFVGFSYIFTSILAYYVLGEPVDTLRWVGVVVIAVGTALIGLS